MEQDNKAPKERQSTGGLDMHGDMDQAAALENAEDWEDWETKLVMWSIGIGIGVLVVFGAIINMTILAK